MFERKEMSILFAILIFEAIIIIHELGHFIAAKASGVKVNEFAIGMGPAIIKKKKGDTLYAWRVFPIGGYCAMEGEDNGSEDDMQLLKAASRNCRLRRKKNAYSGGRRYNESCAWIYYPLYQHRKV